MGKMEITTATLSKILRESNHLTCLVKTEFYSFCGARDVGFGKVTFLRLVNASNQVHVNFLMGRARVSLINVNSMLRAYSCGDSRERNFSKENISNRKFLLKYQLCHVFMSS